MVIDVGASSWRFDAWEKHAVRLVLLAVAFAAWPGSVYAQDFPTRPITLIMPWGAGTDLTIRALAAPQKGILGSPSSSRTGRAPGERLRRSKWPQRQSRTVT
jgi:hypothetical protein